MSLIEVESKCPFEMSDPFPVIVNLNVSLLSSISDEYIFRIGTLKWSKADKNEKKLYPRRKLKVFEIRDKP